MDKYVCMICGYIYDEEQGDASSNIQAGTKWQDIPDSWKCPICKAQKSAFSLKQSSNMIKVPDDNLKSMVEEVNELRAFTEYELSALFSNLSKGCEKQYQLEASELFRELALYYTNKNVGNASSQVSALTAMIQDEINNKYPVANEVASNRSDRGALRALVWSEKVTRMIKVHLEAFEKDQYKELESKKMFVCDICGFIYVGDTVPEICPVCKVPSMKISEIGRG